MKHSYSLRIRPSAFSNVVAVLANLALAYLVYMLCRVVYVLENLGLFAAGWESLDMGEVLRGSLRFDTSAIFYTNSLYIVLMLLPLHVKERHWWHSMCKWIYVVVNGLAASTNLADAVYSQFTGRRTTATFFSEFSNEGNLGGIFATELLNHWYLVLVGVALVAMLWMLYVKPAYPKPRSMDVQRFRQMSHGRRMPDRLPYYVVQTVGLVVMVALSVFGMRGGFTRDTRPITISNANQYVRAPQQAAIVLNTPFSVIRTIGKKPFKNPHYMPDEEVEGIFSPMHTPKGDKREIEGDRGEIKDNTAVSVPASFKGKNVVVLIMESFSREYIGFYNRELDGGTYRGYTPFLDSLLEHSLTWEHTFANGRKSIDAMPSTLSSIPFFIEPFILTPSSLNDLSGLADCLGGEGYSTAFFHGAPNSSMGFQAFARSSGFRDYYGLSDYCDDPRFNGRDDFDGHWAIWDEEFMQYMALTLTERMQEPFMTGFFSASSHHPFVVPKRYEGRFAEGTLPIHVTIGYADNALRRFFDTARKQPWYGNTLFVITADHTNQLEREESKTSLGPFVIPIAIFDPSGQLPQGRMEGVAQQIDVMPTLLGLLGYERPYLAFGKDLLDTTQAQWAVNYSAGIYQYIEGCYVLLFDGERATALYNYVADPLQRDNLLGTLPEREQRMTLRLKAIVQDYMIRMTTNRLTVENSAEKLKTKTSN